MEESSSHLLRNATTNIYEVVIIESIIWAKANDHYIRILADDRKRKSENGTNSSSMFCVKMTMNDCKKKILQKKFFVRIHKSAIININKIKELHWGSHYVIMNDDNEFSISRTYRKMFRKKYLSHH